MNGLHAWLAAASGRWTVAPHVAAIVAALCMAADVAIVAQTARPLPERETFLAATRENMAKSQGRQGAYAYKERRTELHTNPFGRIGTGGVRVYDVTPGEQPGVWLRRLIEDEGKPVANAKVERKDRRNRGQSRSSIDDVVNMLTFAIDRREAVGGRDAIVVRFAARPDAKPQTREGRLATTFAGQIWVDEGLREVTRVDATAVDTISYGYGLLARLNKGTKVTLVRERIDDEVWQPTSIRFVGDGRAMLFRKLNVDFAIEWFDYRRVR